MSSKDLQKGEKRQTPSKPPLFCRQRKHRPGDVVTGDGNVENNLRFTRGEGSSKGKGMRDSVGKLRGAW